jgi:hypothetical protein
MIVILVIMVVSDIQFLVIFPEKQTPTPVLVALVLLSLKSLLRFVSQIHRTRQMATN